MMGILCLIIIDNGYLPFNVLTLSDKRRGSGLIYVRRGAVLDVDQVMDTALAFSIITGAVDLRFFKFILFAVLHFAARMIPYDRRFVAIEVIRIGEVSRGLLLSINPFY